MKNPKIIKKIIKANKGRVKSQEETRKRIKSLKEWYKNNKDTDAYRLRLKRMSRANKGRKLTKKQRKKISESQKGKKLSKEHKEKISKSMKGNLKLKRSLRKFFKEKGVSRKTRKKLSKSTKKLWKNEDYRNKCSNSGWKMKLSGRRKIAKSKIGDKNPSKKWWVKRKIGNSMKKNWKEKKYKEKFIKSQRLRPNNKEKIIIKLIKKNNLPLSYVGNSKVWFTAKNNARFNPDFIDKKNKIIVEHFGSFWHNNSKDIINKDKLRIKTFKSLGYDVIIVKEDELNNLNKVENKLINIYR